MTLEVCTNNLAITGYRFFEKAMLEFGIPSKIRVDGGGEFNFHESFMNSLDEQKRCLRGKSVHNTRIERLWRDCREKILDKYILTFEYMEKHLILDVLNNIHIFALHFVYKKRIGQDLAHWQEAHNNHPIRTENNKTPIQLWLSGSLLNRFSSSSAMRNLFLSSTNDRNAVIDRFRETQNWEEPLNITHVLSSIDPPLSIPELERLCNLVDPLSHSQSNGIDIYGSVVNYINQCLNSV